MSCCGALVRCDKRAPSIRACPPEIRTHRYPTRGDVHDKGRSRGEGRKRVGSAKTNLPHRLHRQCARSRATGGGWDGGGVGGKGEGEGRKGGSSQNRPKEDGHPAPALRLAARCLLLPHFDNWRVGGQVKKIPSPPLTNSENSDFNNPNSCKPRALSPAVGSDFNRHLRTCALCPAAYLTMNNSDIPYHP